MSCEGCPSKGNCSKDSTLCSVQTNPKNHIKHVIAVLSGKGGVGKSTVTVLLARALKQMGLQVGVMDADITGPSIPRLFGIESEKAYATGENEIIPVKTQEGIEVMSLNYLLKNEDDPVIWRGPIVGNVVKQFYTDVIWGDLDVLLIDMPPGTGDVALTILQQLPVQGVIMVSTPQPMVSMIVSKAVHMCEQMHVPVLGILENMAYLDCPHCGERIDFYNTDQLSEFLESSGLKLYGTLPMMDLIRDVSGYEGYDLRSREQVDGFMKDVAAQVMTDVTASAQQQA
ncbi:Mrp/NBP35 family ATP-binding protein [Faecalibaculum rodentium]|uniref:Iron-sulfur cluster carrier protein n=1 Tax=Faecalibaculum rodentium TaxID=1702221 RepID=A0A1Q9YKR6_9FIRM|nr:Mrp/NBP35 family ATP-binding protein [Faecalibaculum rodentium]OLU45225.1 sodium:proton antiporter [Faecalibaculum rodentium]